MAIQENSQQIDATWNAVAEQLGAGWSWSRTRWPDDELDNWRGWLIGPDDLRFWIHLGNPRWEIGEALDTLVSQSGERCYVRDLYSRGERPVTSITVGRGRAAVAIAREIERRLLPSTIESRDRLRARREERSGLDARRCEAVEAILDRWPATHRCEPHSHEAPRLLIGPDAALDLRIDDRDSITITRWSGLSLESLLRIIDVALPSPP